MFAGSSKFSGLVSSHHVPGVGLGGAANDTHVRPGLDGSSKIDAKVTEAVPDGTNSFQSGKSIWVGGKAGSSDLMRIVYHVAGVVTSVGNSDTVNAPVDGEGIAMTAFPDSKYSGLIASDEGMKTISDVVGRLPPKSLRVPVTVMGVVAMRLLKCENPQGGGGENR